MNDLIYQIKSELLEFLSNELLSGGDYGQNQGLLSTSSLPIEEKTLGQRAFYRAKDIIEIVNHYLDIDEKNNA